ncbi:MAG: hypothetical protein QOF90_3130, partial [Acetobacteraceae bacterium]|nr:hypothetical protein [Acetobacteraceae bacterium]
MRNKRTNTPAVAQRIALILFVLAGTV